MNKNVKMFEDGPLSFNLGPLRIRLKTYILKFHTLSHFLFCFQAYSRQRDLKQTSICRGKIFHLHRSQGSSVSQNSIDHGVVSVPARIS